MIPYVLYSHLRQRPSSRAKRGRGQPRALEAGSAVVCALLKDEQQRLLKVLMSTAGEPLYKGLLIHVIVPAAAESHSPCPWPQGQT